VWGWRAGGNGGKKRWDVETTRFILRRVL